MTEAQEPRAKGDFPGLTSYLEREAGNVEAALERTRTRGYATLQSGFEADVTSCACPVFDAEGNVFGAVAVAAPESRVTDITPFTKVLLCAARDITTETGGVWTPERSLAAE